MTPRKRKSRIYWRTRGGVPRAYLDLRDFADVVPVDPDTGTQPLRVPLVAKGERNATADPDVAESLAAARIRQLEASRRGKALIGVTREGTLHDFAAEHLTETAKGIRRDKITPAWVASHQQRLEVAIAYFGAERDVASITTKDVKAYLAHLEDLPNNRRNGGTLAAGTVRHYLNALSSLFVRAQSEGLVPAGYNPVRAMMDKPSVGRKEAAWLEVPEATLFLEATRTYRPKKDYLAHPAAYELLATFLLTGGRETEVYGLAVEDISFDRRLIHFRPNKWRRLKTKTSHRTVPLWPQLEEVLRPYVFGGSGPKAGLLFPSARTGKLITDIRKTLDGVASRIGWEAGAVRTKAFRHTYCAARLQTLDRGAPVSPWTVARELGHGGRDLVDRVYGHLGTIGTRSEVVEYRPEHYMESHGALFADLRAG